MKSKHTATSATPRLAIDDRDIPPKAQRYTDRGLIVDDALLTRYRHAPDNCVGAHPSVTRALVREIDALREIVSGLAALQQPKAVAS